jgi:hypothetical protein
VAQSPSMDVQIGEPIRVGDRFGQRCERAGLGDALMRAVLVVEDLVLAQRVHQVPLVEDQSPVKQLSAAGGSLSATTMVHDRRCMRGLTPQARIQGQTACHTHYGYRPKDCETEAGALGQRCIAFRAVSLRSGQSAGRCGFRR